MQCCCVVQNCFSSSETVDLFVPPTNERLKGLWTKFVQKTRPYFKLTKDSKVCALHFEENAFINYSRYTRGLANNLILKINAIPTILPVASVVKEENCSPVKDQSVVLAINGNHSSSKNKSIQTVAWKKNVAVQSYERTVKSTQTKVFTAKNFG